MQAVWLIKTKTIPKLEADQRLYTAIFLKQETNTA